ncbi:MAG: hypothetical protein V1913_06350 [Fibrobacterota bacterium]
MPKNSILAALLLAAALQAASVDGAGNPLSLSFAGVCASMAVPSASLFSNPAWLGAAQEGAVFSASVQSLFGVPGLHQGQAGVELPFHGFGLSAGAAYLRADTLYRELVAAAGLSRAVRRLRLGASFECASAGFEEEGADYAFALNAGACVRLLYGLHGSIAVRHLTTGTLFNDAGVLPRQWRTGVCYEHEWLRISLEAEYETGFPVSVAFAQEMRLAEGFRLRAGLRSDPLTFGFGCSVGIRGLSAETGFRTHPELGLSKAVGLTYQQPVRPEKLH